MTKFGFETTLHMNLVVCKRSHCCLTMTELTLVYKYVVTSDVSTGNHLDSVFNVKVETEMKCFQVFQSWQGTMCVCYVYVKYEWSVSVYANVGQTGSCTGNMDSDVRVKLKVGHITVLHDCYNDYLELNERSQDVDELS